VGLAPRLFERHDELVAGAFDLVYGCRCDAGCPACTGPRFETGGSGKRLALQLLVALSGAQSNSPSGLGESGAIPAGTAVRA
jgi:DEAD/DEAH box helicase domain-containing protein